MTDIEIAKSVELKKITEIAQAIDITEDELEMYGKYKAKISDEAARNSKTVTEKKTSTIWKTILT